MNTFLSATAEQIKEWVKADVAKLSTEELINILASVENVQFDASSLVPHLWFLRKSIVEELAARGIAPWLFNARVVGAYNENKDARYRVKNVHTVYYRKRRK